MNTAIVATEGTTETTEMETMAPSNALLSGKPGSRRAVLRLLGTGALGVALAEMGLGEAEAKQNKSKAEAKRNKSKKSNAAKPDGNNEADVSAESSYVKQLGMYGGGAQVTLTFGSLGKINLRGTVWDNEPDGKCARVEWKAKTASGTGSWIYRDKTRTCGNQSRKDFDENDYYLRLEGAWIRLCVGSSCTSAFYYSR